MQLRDKFGRFAGSDGKTQRKRRLPKEPKAFTNQKINLIAIVLDKSNSMDWCTNQLVKAYNELIEELKSKAKTTHQQTFITLISFGYRAQIMQYSTPIEVVLPMHSWSAPDGATALLEGICLAAQTLDGIPTHGLNDVSKLVITLTDGGENVFSVSKIDAAHQIAKRQALGNWTFAFQVPKGGKIAIQELNVPVENIREWDQSRQGFAETHVATVSAVGTYFNARAAGATATNAFYAPVTTNLGNLSQGVVKTKLDDLSPKFKTVLVDKEAKIKELVEAKTKSPYVIGQAYYQLMKGEKVQPQKSILIMEKGKTPIWGGQEARDLIGLPQGKHAKVTPGNHSDYDIYVQSTSTNRILPRGTKILIDLTLTQGLAPTWQAKA